MPTVARTEPNRNGALPDTTPFVWYLGERLHDILTGNMRRAVGPNLSKSKTLIPCAGIEAMMVSGSVPDFDLNGHLLETWHGSAWEWFFEANLRRTCD